MSVCMCLKEVKNNSISEFFNTLEKLVRGGDLEVLGEGEGWTNRCSISAPRPALRMSNSKDFVLFLVPQKRILGSRVPEKQKDFLLL